MNDSTEAVLIRKLDILISLTAIAVLEEKPKKEQIALLDRVGFAPRDIAAIIRTTPNTVSVVLSQLRKANRKAKRPRKKE